jgi:intron-binding protein aquarius
LWPNFKPEVCSKAHILSIVMMVNEKFRERVPAWAPFQRHPDHFPAFFHQVANLGISVSAKTVSETFLDTIQDKN